MTLLREWESVCWRDIRYRSMEAARQGNANAALQVVASGGGELFFESDLPVD